MKYYLLFFILLATNVVVYAQNVGIGTTTPQFVTDIVDPTATTLMRLKTLTDDPGSRTLLRFSTTTSANIGNFNSSYIGNYRPTGGGGELTFGVSVSNLGPVERMRLDQNGNIGLSVAEPLARLHINMLNTTNADAIIIDDDADPVVRFRRNGNDLGFFQFLGNDFKMGTSIDNNTGRVILRTNGADRVFVDENGNTGIGNGNPAARLHVEGDMIVQDASPSILLRGDNGTSVGFLQTFGNNLLLGTAIGTTTPLRFYTAGLERAVINQIGNFGYGTSTPSTNFHLDFSNSANFEPFVMNFTGGTRRVDFRRLGSQYSFIEIAQDIMSMGTYGYDHLAFRTNSIERARIHNNGGMSLRTTNLPTGYVLSVNGRILCTDVVTLPYDDWPDYVFTPKHNLLSLHELDKFIRKNQHLPNIPSAASIKKDGLTLGEMQRLQMEKIEELTLYVIELKKEIDALKKR